MIVAGKQRLPARLPLERLNQQARNVGPAGFDLGAEIDRGLPFVCPTCTPLYHTECYGLLGPEQALRYNQMTALSLNELIRFLEVEMGGTLMPALARWTGLPGELREYLGHFATEEREHAEMWSALNRRAAPDWYAGDEALFVRPSRALRVLLRTLARRPRTFIWLIWLVLSMEELSLEVARRSVRADVSIEPQFLSAYRSHQKDEIRHVQVDWYLIERLRENARPFTRRWNARVLRFVIGEYFLAPVRAGRRVLRKLVGEFPELRPHVPRILEQYRRLARTPSYEEALYSRRSHPITFALFDRYPEFHAMSEVLGGYEAPQQREGNDRD